MKFIGSVSGILLILVHFAGAARGDHVGTIGHRHPRCACIQRLGRA